MIHSLLHTFKFHLFFLLFTLSLAAQERYPVHVTKIVDGDTFWATDANGQRIKFRPIGFDCPEKSNFGRPAEPYNHEATAYTSNLIADQTVDVEYDVQTTDQWGRHLVYVYLSDGRMLNEEILKAGWAQLATYPPNIRYVNRFRSALHIAREQNKGIW